MTFFGELVERDMIDLFRTRLLESTKEAFNEERARGFDRSENQQTPSSFWMRLDAETVACFNPTLERAREDVVIVCSSLQVLRKARTCLYEGVED